MKKTIIMTMLSLLLSCSVLAQGVNFSTYVAKVTIMQEYDTTFLMPPPVLNDEAVLPGFPSQLWQRGIAGEIHYTCAVDKQGGISRYEITKCTNDGFKEVFVRAVKTWTYRRLDDLFYREVGAPEKKAIKDDKKIIYPLTVKGIIRFGIHDDKEPF
jgi:hypothetical protein